MLKKLSFLTGCVAIIMFMTQSCTKTTEKTILGPTVYDTTLIVDSSIITDTVVVHDTVIQIDTIIQVDTVVHVDTIEVACAPADGDYYLALQKYLLPVANTAGAYIYFPAMDNTDDFAIATTGSSSRDIQLWAVLIDSSYSSCGYDLGPTYLFHVVYNGSTFNCSYSNVSGAPELSSSMNRRIINTMKKLIN